MYAFMQADTSCEVFARLPTGQEREGWIWRLHGNVNGMRTASRDITGFLAGVLTKWMGFTYGQLLFVHESNETRAVAYVDAPLTCAKHVTLGTFWISHCEVGAYQQRRGTQSSRTCGRASGLSTAVFKNPDAEDLL